MGLRYKFVELTAVTAASLEDTVNQWVGDGWQLDAIRFVTGENAKRPKMAFVSFVREDADEGEGREVDLPAVSSIRRGRPKIVELGELDLGDVEPFEADLDWANARRGPSAARAEDPPPPPKAALRRGRAAPGAGRPRASRSDRK